MSKANPGMDEAADTGGEGIHHRGTEKAESEENREKKGERRKATTLEEKREAEKSQEREPKRKPKSKEKSEAPDAQSPARPNQLSA